MTTGRRTARYRSPRLSQGNGCGSAPRRGAGSQANAGNGSRNSAESLCKPEQPGGIGLVDLPHQFSRRSEKRSGPPTARSTACRCLTGLDEHEFCDLDGITGFQSHQKSACMEVNTANYVGQRQTNSGRPANVDSDRFFAWYLAGHTAQNQAPSRGAGPGARVATDGSAMVCSGIRRRRAHEIAERHKPLVYVAADQELQGVGERRNSNASAAEAPSAPARYCSAASRPSPALAKASPSSFRSRRPSAPPGGRSSRAKR